MYEHKHDPILCYVLNQWAYFTPHAIEHVACEAWDHAEPKTLPDAAMLRHLLNMVYIGYRGPLRTPIQGTVANINEGWLPWLLSTEDAAHEVKIEALTPYSEFIDLIEQAGGIVYLPTVQPAWQNAQKESDPFGMPSNIFGKQ